MRPENILIGLILFILVMTVGFNLFAYNISQYGSDADSGIFTDALRNLSETQSIKEDLRSNTQGKVVSTEDSESALGKTAYPGALSIWDSAKIFGKIMTELSSIFGIPKYLLDAIIAIIGILAAVFLIYWLRGFKPQD